MTGTCPRCDGKKMIKAFGHISAGVCFLCGGAGEVEVKVEAFAAVEPTNMVCAHESFTITVDGDRYTVTSKATGRCVYVFLDGEAVASDSIPRSKRAAAEDWAKKAVAAAI
jgi:hypothetical protein